MSVASELVKDGILPEDDKDAAILVIIGLPISAMEKKYIFIDYCKIYGIIYTKDDVTRATGRRDV